MTAARVIIVVAPSLRLEEVKAACTARGLKDAECLDSLHMLLGTIERDHIANLQAVPGVLSVDEEGQVRAT